MVYGFIIEINFEMFYDLWKDRKVVENVEIDVYDFIYKNFYVDDGLVFCCIFEEVINLFVCICVLYDIGKFRLYKFVLNNREVLNLFL